jgi:hypothetical protein
MTISYLVKFRVSPAEYAAMKRQADSLGVEVSELARSIIAWTWRYDFNPESAFADWAVGGRKQVKAVKHE